ncbi:MAG: site-specific integrase, partial [Planctomycetes bacterium]|nr:site-specific integrase [Planctomycetota bacterium]
MAWLEQHPISGTYQLNFRLGGAKFKRSLKTSDEREAATRQARVEENIRLVEAGRLVLPEHGDPASFLLSDGKLNGKPKVAERLALADLIERYRAALPKGALESESLRVTELHVRHFVRILGVRKKLADVSLANLQDYVLQRSREPGKRGKRVGVGTIRKELATLTTLWNWAAQHGYVTGQLPKRGLKFPKLDERAPFQTYSQIIRQIERGRLTATQEAELWDSLYLSTSELADLLDVLQNRCNYGFLYPMAFMAAHTGARRSELCRSREVDFDFESATILIREKKRSKGKLTTRLVPMTPSLKHVLEKWFVEKEGSAFAFPSDHKVERTPSCTKRLPTPTMHGSGHQPRGLPVETQRRAEPRA